MTTPAPPKHPWPRVGVMGAGAIGCLYGAWLSRAGASVAVVARARHVAAIRESGLRATGTSFDFRIPVSASTDPEILEGCDLILFSTKTRDTEEAARLARPFLAPEALVLCFQNGVDGTERLSTLLPNPVFPAALVVSCFMAGPGHVHHNGRGDVVIGEWFPEHPEVVARRARLRDLAATFERAGIKSEVADDIRVTLWTKLAMNCAYNALSALGRARYERLVRTEASRVLMRQVVEELVAVGRADGVALDFETVLKQVMDLAQGFPAAISSTAQDIASRRGTEIADLNGSVVRRGKAMGVATPLNEVLERLVRVLEEAPVDPAFFPSLSTDPAANRG